jgi:hypothetical protein
MLCSRVIHAKYSTLVLKPASLTSRLIYSSAHTVHGDIYMSASSKKPPMLSQSNPGNGTHFEISYDEEGTKNFELVDLIEMMVILFKKTGEKITKHDGWIEHIASGLQILPQFVDLETYPDGSVRTQSTIQLSHPDYFPEGIFEFQHSDGSTVVHSLFFGFAQWQQQCLNTILDSLRAEPEDCHAIRTMVPVRNGLPQHARKATFGHVLQLTAEQETIVVANEQADPDHSFCDCCLFTKNLKTFAPLFESNRYYCLLLYAARYPNGDIVADCRINGEDFPEGISTLIEYAATWPGQGFESRKQYVVLNNDDIR